MPLPLPLHLPLSRAFAPVLAVTLAVLAGAAAGGGCFPAGEMVPFEGTPEAFERGAPPPVLAVKWRLTLSEAAPLEVPLQERASPGFVTGDKDLLVASASGKVMRLDPDTREKRWEFTADGGVDCTPLQPAGSSLAYFGADDGALYAVDVRDGRLAWRLHTRGEIDGPLAWHDGLVFFTNSDDTLYAVDGTSGTLRWSARRDVPEGFGLRGSSPPTVSGDTVYCGFADGYVAGFDVETGVPRWTADLASGKRTFTDVDGRPYVGDGIVYAASFSGGVHALSSDGGVPVWHRADALGVGSVVGSGAASTSGRVEAAAAADGTTLWSVPAHGRLTDPLIAGGLLIVGSSEDGLMVFDRTDGRLLRTFAPGSPIGAPPAVNAGGVYVTSEGGYLYRLDFI
jgi:outer membrane protein assembly factor BamB